MGVVHGRGDYFDHLKVCASAPWPHVHDLTTTRDVRHVCADSEHHTDGGGVVCIVWLHASPHELHGGKSTLDSV